MPLVPRHIRDLESYKPGQSIINLKNISDFNHIVKLASNENPMGCSPKAINAVAKSLKENYRYPDASSLALRNKLARKFELKIENVTVGAGSEGVMSAIMRTFLKIGDEIIAADNSFIGFRVLANASGIRTNWIPLNEYFHDLNAMSDQINEYTKIIYLANPDNPTGTYFTISDFDRFMRKVPERVLVILDEAYFEYAEHLVDYPDSMHYRYDNVITLRTFSKAHGLAGFRVGYGFAHENLIENLLKIKLPFEPSWPAQVAAMSALDDEEYIKDTVGLCRKGMKKIKRSLNQKKIKYIPSAANFLTLEFNNKEEAKSFNELMFNKGIILRYLAGWGLPNCIRITIGTEDENEYLLGCLNDVLAEA